MPSIQRTLPLFMLNTVLFPGASIPIQIFEQRYKLMLRDCLSSDSKLGVILIKTGSEVGEPAEPHSTGTLASIVQASETSGGRYFISVTGQQRFRIEEIAQYRPYIAAQVKLLEEDTDASLRSTEIEVVLKALTDYSRLVAGLAGGWVRRAHGPLTPLALSYRIADMLQVEMSEKQSLLEEPTPAERLESELDILRRESEILRRRMSQEFLSRQGRQ